MSYESDPSGQPLPGDSDSLNRAGQGPQEEQNSWLLDGEAAPLAPQPVDQRPASESNWLLDGEDSDEPSLVVTEDSEGDSWLMNLDEPTVTVDVDEKVQEHGFAASYCEPESTASVFGRLLVPSVFVAVLSVGGLLVWRSMSGLGVEKEGTGSGGVVFVPGGEDQGEVLSGPTFEVPGSSRSASIASLRGNIQRDGSVKQNASKLTTKVVQGQFGFTPSSQNRSIGSVLKPVETPEETAAVIETESLAQAEATPLPVQEFEVEAEAPEIAQDESLVEVSPEESEGTLVSGFFGLAFFVGEFENSVASSTELYTVQPSQGRLLSFAPRETAAFVEPPLWGPGTPVEPSIALEFEGGAEELEPSMELASLLTEEQENLLALVDEDSSIELAFMWVDESMADEAVASIEGTEMPSTDADSLGSFEDQELESLALAEEFDDFVRDPGFVDDLLAKGPVTGFEDVPDGQEGFLISPLENWLENEQSGTALVSIEALDSELAVVEEAPVSALPISEGLDAEGNWLAGEGYEKPTEPVLVAMGEAEQAIIDLWTVEDASPLVEPSVEQDSSVLASVEEPVVLYSVPTDLESGTLASIEPMFLGNPFFELEEIGMVPVQGSAAFDWIDPLGNSMLVDEPEFEGELVAEQVAMEEFIEDATGDIFEDTTEESVEGIQQPILLAEVESEFESQVETETELEVELPLLVHELEQEASLDNEVELAAEHLNPGGEEVALEQELAELSEPSDENVDSSTELEAEPSAAEVAHVAEDFQTDGSPTALVASELGIEGDPFAPEESELAAEPVLVAPEPIAIAQADVEPTSAMEELFEVQTTPQADSVEDAARVEPVDQAPIAGASSERNLLDMYSDWNQAEDEGQLQPLSASKWLNFSIGDGPDMPFRMAQASMASRGEERSSETTPVEVKPEVKKPRMGVLKRLKADSSHWQGLEIPMHALGNATVLLTPKVGPVRVIGKDGETTEGRLHGIGQNYVWLTTNLGRLSIPSRRVQRVERIDPGQFSTQVKSTQDYTKLPKVRVRMKGGVFTGYELARDGNRITIRTEQGHKMTLVSDDIRSATTHRVMGIKRRIE
ncbi:MAG: hypothetical protein JKY61_04120 [Planctomycetes bacterium]|nr:hypothetical protein [Planctomycetota bacterium]